MLSKFNRQSLLADLSLCPVIQIYPTCLHAVWEALSHSIYIHGQRVISEHDGCPSTRLTPALHPWLVQLTHRRSSPHPGPHKGWLRPSLPVSAELAQLRVRIASKRNCGHGRVGQDKGSAESDSGGRGPENLLHSDQTPVEC